MTDDQIIELAIQGHASTRDAIRWAMQQVRRPPPLFDRDIDAVTVQQWGWDVDFAAHRAYARAIEKAIVGAAERLAQLDLARDTVLLRQALEAIELHYSFHSEVDQYLAGDDREFIENETKKIAPINDIRAVLCRRLGICPECGGEARVTKTTYTNIETSYSSCVECYWVGEPE